jgi:anti-anti-sigma factor
LLIVGGEIDVHTVRTLRVALREATILCVRVVVDLDSVTFIGAAGLSALVAADQACRLAGGRVRVCTTNQFTRRLLTLTGLSHLTLSA